MTNFEWITQSPEFLARVITSMLHERDMECMKKLTEKGIDCSLFELDTEIQVQIHKEWLESEVEE